jgi:hypothetical protein
MSKSDAGVINTLARDIRTLETLLVETFGIPKTSVFQILWTTLTVSIQGKFPSLNENERKALRDQIIQSAIPHFVQREITRQLH